MSMKYESMVAMESAAITVNRPENINPQDKIKANFTNYETWAKEVQATGSSLKDIPVEHRNLGLDLYENCSLMAKTIIALNQLLNNVLSKRTALDFTKVTGIKEMEKVGIVASPTILDNNRFRDNDWGTRLKTKEAVQLKYKGWSESKAVGYAKQLLSGLNGVGTYQKFNTALSSINEKLTKNASTSTEDRKRYSAASKQAMHLYKVRHTIIVRAFNEFRSLKKTI